jgi:pfkB family carbohydrate kinase
VDAKHHWDWYEGWRTLAFPNEHEAPAEAQFAHVIWKLGAKGCRMWDAKNGYDLGIPATVTEVVDVTGAGDIFMAGFVWAWTLQLPVEDCLRLANALAGESCRHIGTYVVGREFAQAELDRLRASRESARPTPGCSLGSILLGPPPQSVMDHFVRAANETLANNPDVDYVEVQGATVDGRYTPLGVQIHRQSPSVPTAPLGAPLPTDQESSDEQDRRLR